MHVTGLNLALVIDSLHSKDYIIGDIKPQNISVNDRARISIVDTDSFQVKEKKNGIEKVYRCNVGSEGFTPPELIGQDLSTITQTRYHDRFRLGVIIFYLLFGSHPFDIGDWSAGDRPAQTELIKQGIWLYEHHSLMVPNDTSIPINVIHPKLKELFLKCFNDGHHSPTSRPTAQDWYKALDTAQSSLLSCGKIDTHIYNSTYGHCYWCERSSNLGFDIFADVSPPASVASANTQAPAPINPTQAPVPTTPAQFKPGVFWAALALGAFSIASQQYWLTVIAVLLFFGSFGS